MVPGKVVDKSTRFLYASECNVLMVPGKVVDKSTAAA